MPRRRCCRDHPAVRLRLGRSIRGWPSRTMAASPASAARKKWARASGPPKRSWWPKSCAFYFARHADLLRHRPDARPDLYFGQPNAPRQFQSQQSGAGLRYRQARSVKLHLASERLKVPVERLTAANGAISVQDDPSKKIGYGELVGGKKLNSGESTATRAAGTPANGRCWANRCGARTCPRWSPDSLSSCITSVSLECFMARWCGLPW